ncbi:hypothetical protein HYV43_03855 [Candidatus Micrarchaeota archaeon]|nr:hypothetical protein [Candidatus Micrarchaeota archaeon]
MPAPVGVRGQGSVEYLFVVVFLVGFIVAVLVPALQESELSYAIASVRSQAVAYGAAHPDLRLTVLNYSVQDGRVLIDAQVYNRSSDSLVATPLGLKAAMVAGIHALAPSSGFDGACANTSNYEYCVIS